MLKPLVSIVIPVYKVPETNLRRCIESCIDQSLKNIEIIIVDDGSPDNCGEICDDYAKKDNRISVIHKKNEGLSAARNTGQNNATAEWIMFVDGDDWIETEMCSSLLSATHFGNNIELVMCEWVKDYGDYLKYNVFPFVNGQKFKENDCRDLLGKMLDFNNYLGTVPAKLYYKEFLSMNHLSHDANISHGVEGIIFNLRVFSKLSSAVFISQPLYHYMYNANSITGLMSTKTIDLLVRGLDIVDGEIINNKEKKYLESCFKSRVLSAIITSVLRGIYSPQNNYVRHERKVMLNNLLNRGVVKKYLNMKWYGMPISKRIMLFLIKNKYYGLLSISSILRYYQLKLK